MRRASSEMLARGSVQSSLSSLTFLRSSSSFEIRRLFRSRTFELEILLDIRLLLFMAAPSSIRQVARMRVRTPPHVFFAVSATFHYLGPAFAVLLFARVRPLGVAWRRIATAAVIFLVWRRPWGHFARLPAREKHTIVALGVVVALMNASFYEAVSRIPLGTVAAIEFVGPIALAAAGA